MGCLTTGAGYEDFALILRVKIDEHLSGHKARLHAVSTGQSGFLITCKDALNRTMLNIVACQDSQLDGAAYTVVSTQCSAFCLKPFSVYVSLDGVFVEIEINIYQFIANHVHVALQDDGFSMLVAWSGSFTDEHITGFIYQRFELMSLSERFQKLNHVLLVLGRTRYFVDFCELLEHESRLQFTFIHLFSIILF